MTTPPRGSIPDDHATTRSRDGSSPEVSGGTAGSRLRALEIALARLSMESGLDLSPLSEMPGSDLPALAERLGEVVDLVARVRTLTPETIRAATRAGSVALVCTESSWIVVARGRATVITDTAELSERFTGRTLTRHAGTRRVSGLLLERRLGLEPMSAARLGSKHPWARLSALMALERPELGALVLYAAVIGALSLAVPVAIQVLVNTIAFGGLRQPLLVLAMLLLGILVVVGAIQVLQWYAVELLQRRLFVRVAEDFARRLPGVSLAAHDHFDAHELVNRFFEVVDLQKASSRMLLDGLGLVLQTLTGLALLGFYHPTLLGFAVALVAALVVVVFLGRGAMRSAIAESSEKYKVAAWLESIAASPRLFRRDIAAVFAAHRANALTRSYLAARRGHYRVVFRQLVGGVVVQIIAMVALLGLGGWLVMRGELTLGQLVAAELVVGVVATGIAKMGKYLEAGYDLLASLDKVGKVIDLPRDAQRVASAPAPLGPLALRVAELRPGRGILRVDAVIEAGERVRLDGAGGSGKSTLLETLAGLRAPDGGTIETPGSGASREDLRRCSLLVRHGDVFDGTILDNLRVADPELSEAEARRALASVFLHEVVERHDHGLHTPIFAHGGPLSSTQANRLVLARALLARPRLLLVDGLLDDLGLDDASTETVLETVLGPAAPWTAVVVSNDARVRRRCPRALTVGSETP